MTKETNAFLETLQKGDTTETVKKIGSFFQSLQEAILQSKPYPVEYKDSLERFKKIYAKINQPGITDPAYAEDLPVSCFIHIAFEAVLNKRYPDKMGRNNLEPLETLYRAVFEDSKPSTDTVSNFLEECVAAFRTQYHYSFFLIKSQVVMKMENGASEINRVSEQY